MRGPHREAPADEGLEIYDPATGETIDESGFFSVERGEEKHEQRALDYLTKRDGTNAIQELLRDRLPPGYDVTEVSVAEGKSIEILVVLVAAYRLIKHVNEVIETLTTSAEHVRQVVHTVLDALGGPRDYVAVSLSTTPSVPASASSTSPSIPSIELRSRPPLASFVTRRAIAFALLVITYLALLGVGVAYLLSLI